jgi:rod shape-determining protein MreD
VTAQRFFLGAATVLTALLLQVTVLTRLPLPGAAPDLLLVLVVSYALVEGPLSGMTTGFVAGVLADTLSDHALGRLALAYALVGYLTGFVEDETDRSTLVPFLAAAAGALVAVLVYSVEGILLGDQRMTLHAIGRSLVSSVPYAVVLTPFVLPAVAALVRRVDPEPLRR